MEILEDDEGWDFLEQTARILDVGRAWGEHRDVLAGHLTKAEWDLVAAAARTYAVVTGDVSREVPFADVKRVFMGCRQDLLKATTTLDGYCQRAGRLRNPGQAGERFEQSRSDEVG